MSRPGPERKRRRTLGERGEGWRRPPGQARQPPTPCLPRLALGFECPGASTAVRTGLPLWTASPKAKEGPALEGLPSSTKGPAASPLWAGVPLPRILPWRLLSDRPVLWLLDRDLAQNGSAWGLPGACGFLTLCRGFRNTGPGGYKGTFGKAGDKWSKDGSAQKKQQHSRGGGLPLLTGGSERRGPGDRFRGSV